MNKTQNVPSNFQKVQSILKASRTISVSKLKAMGYKNPYSVIYRLRGEGWVIKTVEGKHGTFYVLKMTAAQKRFDESFMRLFWMVMIFAVIALFVLSIL